MLTHVCVFRSSRVYNNTYAFKVHNVHKRRIQRVQIKNLQYKLRLDTMTSYHFKINNLTIARDISNHGIISLSVIVHVFCTDNQFSESVVFYFNSEITDALVSRNGCYSIKKIKKKSIIKLIILNV